MNEINSHDFSVDGLSQCHVHVCMTLQSRTGYRLLCDQFLALANQTSRFFLVANPMKRLEGLISVAESGLSFHDMESGCKKRRSGPTKGRWYTGHIYKVAPGPDGVLGLWDRL